MRTTDAQERDGTSLDTQERAGMDRSSNMMAHDQMAAVYCRVSTKQQAEEGTSLRSQEGACRKLAQERGFTVATVLREDYPGTELQRPLLDGLRAGIKLRQWLAVFCYATDRLSRSPVHLALIAEECDKAGVALFFVTEPLDTSPEGQLLTFVRGWAAQLEREKIKDRTQRGTALRAAQGKMPRGTGTGIYGYRYDRATGRRQVQEEEARMVRRIYQMAIDGYSLHGICQQFNREGIPAYRGGLWEHTSVKRVLINPAYKGVQYDNRRKRVPLGGNRYRQVWRDPSEWREVPGSTPPIVSVDLWERAQRALADATRVRFQPIHRKYLLNGFIFCSCGARMTGYAQEPHLSYYRCRATHALPHKPKTCTARGLRAEKVEEAVWEKAKWVIHHPEIVLAERENRAKGSALLEVEIAHTQAQLGRLDQEQQRLVKLYRFGEVDDEFITREMSQVKKRQSALRHQLSELQERLRETADLATMKDRVMAFCDQVKRTLEGFGLEDKRLALAALQVKVVVDLEKQVKLFGVLPLDARSLLEPSAR
jgi:site-specific DNA recombinase